jgi:NAD(P)-dependent dehydrogenase (short-subunit alcohol dehydrogenase family)
MKQLEGKVAAITGAANGLGRALAKALAQEGCALALSDIDETGLEETVSMLSTDRLVTSHVVDVSKATQVQEWVESLVDSHGGVHLLFNNAGITVAATFEQHRTEDWENVLDVNLWGVINGCRSFLPFLKREKKGHIVNISSIFGVVAMPAQVAYCTSKYAVRGLSESLWEELHGTNVGVTVVHPGGLATRIVESAHSPSPRFRQHLADFFDAKAMSPDKAASQIVRAVRKGKRRLLVTREAFLFDRVKRLLPVRGNAWCSSMIRKSMRLEKVEGFLLDVGGPPS